MNMLTVTTKNKKLRTYNVRVDLHVLERIAGSLGLFQPQFLKDMKKSLDDVKNKRFVRAGSLKNFR